MSVVLYAAIILIWLFVLVPRWLRRPHELQAVRQEPGSLDQPAPADEVYRSHSDEGYTSHGDASHECDGHERDGHERDGDAGYDAADADAPRARSFAPGPWAGPAPVRRSRVLQARRRLLTILVLLTAVAGTCVALKLTSWLVSVPPAGMLGLYLLLLREAAIADAEQARRRAAMDLRAQAARQREGELRAAEEEQYSAQIIDISARFSDQLYDQYADATVRAVGD